MHKKKNFLLHFTYYVVATYCSKQPRRDERRAKGDLEWSEEIRHIGG